MIALTPVNFNPWGFPICCRRPFVVCLPRQQQNDLAKIARSTVPLNYRPSKLPGSCARLLLPTSVLCQLLSWTGRHIILNFSLACPISFCGTVETGYKVYICPRGNLLYCRPYFINEPTVKSHMRVAYWRQEHAV